MKKYIFLLLFLGQQFIVVSQIQDTALVLKEIVISGEKSSLQSENVSNVEKLTLKNNTDIQGLSLAEKLTSVAGVSNVSTGTGIGKPVIRGLSGSRIAVFSQGVRLENQQWGAEHGLGLDENGYETLEIVKGPASLLYGSDALGGVLSFGGENFAKMNTVESKISSEHSTNTDGWRSCGALKLSKNRFSWNLFGTYTTHKDYIDGAGNAVINSRFRTGDIKTSAAYKGKKFHSLVHYNFLQESYGLTEIDEDAINENMINRALTRTPDLPFQNLQTHIAGSENMIFFDNNSKLKIDLGFVSNHRQELEEEHEHGEVETWHATSLHEEAALDMLLNTFSCNAKWFSPLVAERWKLTVGSQGLYQKNANYGEERLIPNALTAETGAFAVSDFYFSEKSYWQIGIRADNRHISSEADEDFPSLQKNYQAFNFSTGIFLKLLENLSVRANIASGFRAPTMFELLSNGSHSGANRFEIGNENLKTENSYQADFSLNYNSEHLQIFANPYFNCIRRYIYLQPTSDLQHDLPVYQYAQNDAYLYGGEAGFHLHPHPLDWLHVQATYSNVLGQLAGGDCLPLIPSQKINATVKASFEGKRALKKYEFYVQNLYSFAQNRVADNETPTPAYNLLNAGISVIVRTFCEMPLQIDISANNILNAKYFDHLSRYKTDSILNMGRNLLLRVSLPLEFSI